MPSLLPAGAITPTTERYSPLADEQNPVFGAKPSYPSSRHGAVKYDKRIPSTSTIASSTDSDDTTLGRTLRSESEETLSPGTYKGKGKQKMVAEQPTGHGEGYYLDGDDRRLSEGQESTADGEIYGTTHEGKADYKGKGRQLTWEEEHGRVEDMYGEAASQYPPTNEEEEEERRIQENLSRMAARDQARRRAARQSRNLPTHSPEIHGGAFSPRPASWLPSSGAAAKRTSLLGFVGGFWGSGAAPPHSAPAGAEREVQLRRTSTNASDNPFSNPYEDPPSSRRADHPSPVPRMTVTPPHDPPNPFNDPHSPSRGKPDSSVDGTPKSQPVSLPATPDHRRASSSTRSWGPTSPHEGGFSYGYVGPAWRGGQGIRLPDGPGGAARGHDKPDKWWHALCAWGHDLDGGDDPDNQAGRTNPFE